jgi:carbonic anhydrase
MFCDMIDQIIDFNKSFVAQKGYEKYLTDKYPDKKLAVLSCMDTRLTELLPAALGLKNGDAKIIKNAGGLVISAFDSAMRSLIVAIYELGVQEIMVVAHSHCGACHMSYDHFHHEMIARGVTDETLDTIRKCGIDLDQWLEGFKDTPTSVRKTVETIKTHPLVPKDIVVRGFIIDSETGVLEEIQ